MFVAVDPSVRSSCIDRATYFVNTEKLPQCHGFRLLLRLLRHPKRRL